LHAWRVFVSNGQVLAAGKQTRLSEENPAVTEMKLTAASQFMNNSGDLQEEQGTNK
jgi:hypothetical protein